LRAAAELVESAPFGYERVAEGTCPDARATRFASRREAAAARAAFADLSGPAPFGFVTVAVTVVVRDGVRDEALDEVPRRLDELEAGFAFGAATTRLPFL
jgi:hypothetical protein